MTVKLNNEKKILMIFVHPLKKSLNRSLMEFVYSIVSNKSKVNIIDLYDSYINPIMSSIDREFYHDVSFLSEDLEPYKILLQECEALIIIYPTWIGGPPAIMKGFFEKLLKPGISFELTYEHKLQSMNTFSNIKYILAINTHGGSHINATLSGNYSKKFITRLLYWNFGSVAKVSYLGVYNVNKINKLEAEKIFLKLKKETFKLYDYLNIFSDKI
jgi:putative NADPH-quinone reductase